MYKLLKEGVFSQVGEEDIIPAPSHADHTASAAMMQQLRTQWGELEFLLRYAHLLTTKKQSSVSGFSCFKREKVKPALCLAKTRVNSTALR
jgi:hypothetical protein